MSVTTHFEQLATKVSAEGSREYAPTQVPKEKYAKIVEGRNRFFMYTIGAIVAFVGITAMPSMLMNRGVRRMYRTYCKGKVLDLTPKLYDEADVALYELSKAVVVEFLVEKKVVDDGNYKIDASLPEAEKEERRRAMTLDFMIRNDHHWVGSPVNFAVVEREATQKHGFRKYDCVVIRDELMNLSTQKARELFNSATHYVSDDGYVIVMDFGKSSNPRIDRFLKWFNEKTDSSMTLTHNYSQWVEEDLVYKTVEMNRTLFGMYYTICLQKKKQPTIEANKVIS